MVFLGLELGWWWVTECMLGIKPASWKSSKCSKPLSSSLALNTFFYLCGS